MDYIKLPSRPQYREIMDKFLGYDKRLSAAEGSFVEMRNLSSDKYPMLSPRKPRGLIATPLIGGTTGMVMTAQGLCITEGKYLHLGIGGGSYDLGLTNGAKQLVRMGAYVLIFPDKKYINTADPEDRGDIEAEYTTVDQTDIHICISRPDWEEYANEVVSATEPENPKDKTVWINTAEYPNTLHQWNEAAKCWVKITSPSIRLFSMGIGKHFKAGDGITISGIKAAERILDMDTGSEITAEQRKQLEALEGSAVILGRGDDWIVVDGIMDARCTISTVLTIKRSLPTMDFIVEHGNRLWGCRYGKDAGGEFVNILYASKLGDFRNWSVYQGIDADSYFANVGTDGPFTGVIAWGYGDRVLFFKENGFHTVTGDGPGSFRVDWTACDGVQKGSGKSLCELDGVVYYKSRGGVRALSGALPAEIGQPFGHTCYQNAVGGVCGRKYYLSMADTAGAWHLFVWDPELRLWHREDGVRAYEIIGFGQDAYLLTQAGQLRTIRGSAGIRETAVKWSAQTGLLGTEHPDRKRLTRVNVRLRLGQGSRFTLYIRYDSSGSWQRVAATTSARLRAYDFPVRIRRCDHMELRFEGQGDCEIYSIVKTYQMGSDRK